MVDALDRRLVKAQDVTNHAMKCRPEQIPALCKQAIGHITAVLNAAIVRLHAETHLTALRFLTYFIEKANEVRVRAVVEHDKAGIHTKAAPVFLHGDGIGVAACITTRLKYGDVMLLPQVIGRNVARDASSDNGDLHSITSFAARVAVWTCHSRWTRRSSRVRCSPVPIYSVYAP